MNLLQDLESVLEQASGAGAGGQSGQAGGGLGDLLGTLAGSLGGAAGQSGQSGGLGGILGSLAGSLAGGQGAQGGVAGGLSQVLQGLAGAEGQGGALGGLVGPAALGGLAGALFSDKKGSGLLGGALLASGGAYLWNKYKDQIKATYDQLAQGEGGDTYDFDTNSASAPAAAAGAAAATAGAPAASTAGERARRLVKAMIFAAKSDGSIDEKEQAAIYAKLQGLGADAETQQVVDAAMKEPLDPASVAQGVKNADEALEVFIMSCSVIDIDHFMESAYLDGLAKALHIPDDMKAEIEAKVKEQSI